MAKYVVTVTTLWVDGKKYRRGDIIDLNNGEEYGVNVDLYHEPKPEVVEKPAPVKRTRRKKVVNNED